VVALQLPEEPAKELQKIGAVAARSGVSVKTIRFYCDQGLLQPSGRSEGRYRLFDESVDSDLALIRTLRARYPSAHNYRGARGPTLRSVHLQQPAGNYPF
jgi:hypothetical protein